MIFTAHIKRAALVCVVFVCSSLVNAEQFAPEFTLKELRSDQKHSLSDYQGKVVYLDFWASWCGPCRKSLPALSRLQAELGNDKFEVLAINLDADPQDGLAFLNQYPVNYTVLMDRSGRTPQAYELVGLPSSVLVDKRGVIVASWQGFHDTHIDKLRRAIGFLTE